MKIEREIKPMKTISPLTSNKNIIIKYYINISFTDGTKGEYIYLHILI